MSNKTLTPRPSTLSRETFVNQYGEIYEHSSWVAEIAWDKGLSDTQDTPTGLADVLGAILNAAEPERQLEVIRAHPDLAGTAAIAGELTDDSTKEQAGAGLDQCSSEELARFERLNQAYKDQFGFPFVIAVKGKDRHDILEAFETRLKNSVDEERRTAIEQINQIARFRLEGRVT